MGPLGVRSNVVAPGMIGGTEGAERLTMKGAADASKSTCLFLANQACYVL